MTRKVTGFVLLEWKDYDGRPHRTWLAVRSIISVSEAQDSASNRHREIRSCVRCHDGSGVSSYDCSMAPDDVMEEICATRETVADRLGEALEVLGDPAFIAFVSAFRAAADMDAQPLPILE